MFVSSLDLDMAPANATPADFRKAARRFASGVTVVTTRTGTAVHGATVSAFFTLSLEPLQVLVSLGRAGRLAAMLRESAVFAVCVLAAEQEAVSRAFAAPARPTAEGLFPDVASRTIASGAPIIDGCLAFFDCALATTIDQGDHTLFIGAVQAVGARDGAPLVYFDGAYRRLEFE